MRKMSWCRERAALLTLMSCAFCILALLDSAVVRAQAKKVSLVQYSHAAWRVQDGFFIGSPSSTAQTTDGYLWIGTSNGLFRFDGTRFVPWIDPSTSQPYHLPVYTLLPLGDGSLLLGGSGNVSRLKGGELKILRGPVGRFNVLRQDLSGTVWVARSRINDSNGPLCKVGEDTLQCIGTREHLDCQYGTALATDASGTVWIGGPDEICGWDHGRATHYTVAELKSQRSLRGISALVPAGDGSLWAGLPPLGANPGLWKFDHGSWTAQKLTGIDPTALDVTELFLDHDGSLWIGTSSHGLYHIVEDNIDHFGSDDGLTSDFIQNIFEDRERNIWVTTTSGVDRLQKRTVVTLSKRNGLSADLASTVSAAVDGSVQIGNLGGVDILHPAGTIASLITLHVPGRTVTTALQSRDGESWIGVDNSLLNYSNGRWHEISLHAGTPFGAVFAICEDHSGQIWVVTAGKQSALFRIGHDRLAKEITALHDQHVVSSAASPVDGIWVGLTNNSAVHITSQGVLDQTSEFPSKGGAQNLSSDEDGSLWISRANGLIRLFQGHWTKLGLANGLPCDTIFSSIKDKTGALWLYASCGIIKIPKEQIALWVGDPSKKVAFELFDSLKGAQTSYSPFKPSVTMTTDGRLWFASANMVQMLDPQSLQRNFLPPPVQIESLTADHKAYAVTNSIRLPVLTRDVEIDYTGLSFVAPQKVNFRYRLSGAEANWNDVTARRQAFYMNLGPGTYTFRVEASNNDGVWNQKGASVTFVIPPTLIQTVWFRVLLGSVILLLLTAAIIIRLRHISEAIRSQLSERMVERERIARELHDTLLQGFQGLILRFGTAAANIPKGEPSKAMMESALDRADEVLLEGRNRVRDLRADDVTSSDLLTALSDFSDELTIGQAAAFDVKLVGNERELHPIVREEAYWIGREALANAQSHASATAIRLSLDFGPKAFVLTCVDNGRGIEAGILAAGAREGHWGLSGMRERAAKIGGTVRITCDGEPGTRVTLRVPAAVAYRKSKGQSRVERLKMRFR